MISRIISRTVYSHLKPLVGAQVRNVHNKTQSIVKQQSTTLQKIRWWHLPIVFVTTFEIFDEIRSYRLKEIAKKIKTTKDDLDIGQYYQAHRFEIWLYNVIPFRMISRLWGHLNDVELPESLREPILGLYARAFKCNLQEANDPDLKNYKNLQEFFRRALKPNVRMIDGDGVNTLVSPADGRVLYFGKVEGDQLEQVKGVNYSIQEFLGSQDWKEDAGNGTRYRNSLLKNPSGDTELYHCIIYLAPGDYHRFHSPSNWKVQFRRHFSGRLYSVRPTFAMWFPNLFSVNERVAYIGEWAHGFFSMVPVGATNVGSMRMYFDKDLITNKFGEFDWHFSYEDKRFDDPVGFKPGDAFGEFNLGSTIVLLFEAPKNFRFTIQSGQRLEYGKLIGHIDSLYEKREGMNNTIQQ